MVKSFHFKATPEQIYTVLSKGIAVYPVYEFGCWYIESNDNGRITRFKKAISQSEINTAIAKTIVYYASK